MKILFVVDQFDSANNGTTVTAQRFAKVLIDHGNEVRVVTTGEDAEWKYVVPEFRVPVFDKLIKSQGMMFARGIDETLEEAVDWADVIHMITPFPLSKHCYKIAKAKNVPCTAAFHVQPENITSSIGMGNLNFINYCIYKGFLHKFFCHFSHIHCPSKFIAGELKRHGYKAKLHVISNGIQPLWKYHKSEKKGELAGKIVILMVGRLSQEKRQDVLIKAIAKSQYADKIQLVLAGKGPKYKKIKKLGDKLLKNKPIIDFYTTQELYDLIGQCDLYVHSADVEIEAISCIEAFASGLVPVIANSKKSATPQFALDERSLFKAGNPESLASKIDYWINNNEEREKMEHIYSEKGKDYQIDRCVTEIEEMYRMAIEENSNDATQ